jgi:cell division protein FtsB
VVRRRHLLLRTATFLLGAVVAAAAVFLFVFPTAQWREQRRQIDETKALVTEAEEGIEAVQQRIDDLEDPLTIERLARERFGFVLPDEQAFRLQPVPGDAATFPEAWPWEGFARLVNGAD